jgi:hypothetical protein
MFDCQVQRSYYDFYNMEYNYMYITGDSIDTYSFSSVETEYKKQDFNKLINIIDNAKLNQIGDAEGSLSKSWYLRNKNNECITQIKKNLYNFFRNVAKTPAGTNLWTTFSDFKESVKGKGYAKGFLSCNARAVNMYRNCTSLAYTVNRYFDPRIKNFFIRNNIRVEEDQYALSELIQWIFRSALRDGKEVTIYLPSKRMRVLLENWVANQTVKN